MQSDVPPYDFNFPEDLLPCFVEEIILNGFLENRIIVKNAEDDKFAVYSLKFYSDGRIEIQLRDKND